MYSERGWARDLYSSLVYQEATTDQVPGDILGGTGWMGMHIDVGGYAIDGGWWLAWDHNPWEYLRSGHGQLIHVSTAPQDELLHLYPRIFARARPPHGSLLWANNGRVLLPRRTLRVDGNSPYLPQR
jgi:hypothetical protein